MLLLSHHLLQWGFVTVPLADSESPAASTSPLAPLNLNRQSSDTLQHPARVTCCPAADAWGLLRALQVCSCFVTGPAPAAAAGAGAAAARTANQSRGQDTCDAGLLLPCN